MVQDTVYSNLLPVRQMPRYIYGAPCTAGKESEVQPKGASEAIMTPFVVRGGRLWAFQDLRDDAGPFAHAVTCVEAEQHVTAEWYAEADRLGWYIALLNRCLNKLTGRLGLNFDREHQRYYFEPDEPGMPKEVTYRPLNARKATRSVVWQPKKKSTGEARGYWLHRGGQPSLHPGLPGMWLLSIRPELRVTSDGMPADRRHGISAGGSPARSHACSTTTCWARCSSGATSSGTAPRRSSCRSGQAAAAADLHLDGQRKVRWPGIPDEHAKPFKNVEYLDDLFTWAEAEGLLGEDATTMSDDETTAAWDDLDDGRGDRVTVARPRPAEGITGRSASPLISSDYLPEPLLLFADDGLHVDPKAGHRAVRPQVAHLHWSASQAAARRVHRRRRAGRCRPPLAGRARPRASTATPRTPSSPAGCPTAGSSPQLEFADPWDEELGQAELRQVLEIRSQKDRFEALLQLLEGKLRMLAERDNPPEYIVIALSDEIVSRCGTADYTSSETGAVHRDLRRALKAAAMKYRIPTQILQAAHHRRPRQDAASRIAWNFFTGMYCKAGGYPWSPHGLDQGHLLRRNRLLPAAGQRIPDHADQPHPGIRRARRRAGPARA